MPKKLKRPCSYQGCPELVEGRKNDPSFYPVIFGADEDDDWTSPEVWKKANLPLGITVDQEKLEIACNNARQNPAEDNIKLRVNRDHVPYDIFVRTDPAGNIKPDKEKSTERIAGAVALIMALDRTLRNQGAHSNESVYDERGLLFF